MCVCVCHVAHLFTSLCCCRPEVDISNRFELFNILDVDLGGAGLKLDSKGYRRLHLLHKITEANVATCFQTTNNIVSYCFNMYRPRGSTCCTVTVTIRLATFQAQRQGELSPHELLTGLLSLRGEVTKGSLIALALRLWRMCSFLVLNRG